MNSKPRSSLTNLVSALAVALSLVFVGFEIRQNTVAQQSSTIEGVFSQRNDFNLATLTDDGMVSLLRRLYEGATSAEFTPDEIQKGRLWLVTFLRIIESAERQVAIGVLERSQVLDTFESIRPVAALPFFQEQWPTLRRNFAPDFISYLEAEIVQ